MPVTWLLRSSQMGTQIPKIATAMLPGDRRLEIRQNRPQARVKVPSHLSEIKFADSPQVRDNSLGEGDMKPQNPGFVVVHGSVVEWFNGILPGGRTPND